MYRHVLAWTLVVCTLLVCRSAPAAEPLAPRAEWIPRDAVIVVDIAQPQQLLDQLLDDRVTNAVTAAPQYQAATDNAEFKQLVGLVKYYQEKYKVDFRGLAGKLLGGGITWAIGPNEASLLIVDTEDAKLLEEVHEFIRVVARGEAEKRGQGNPITSAEYRGLTGWRFGPNEAHAIVGSRLVLTNKPDWLKAAADLRADGSDASVAKSPNFRTAREAVGAGAMASIYADLALLKQIPQLQAALSKNNENPLASLLFAPAVGGDARVELAGDRSGYRGPETGPRGGDGRHASATPRPPKSSRRPPRPQGGAMPNFAVPRQLASLSFYRDLHKFYAAKDKLFPERTSGLIFFENMMGIFFTGRDLTDEVLAETTPEVRFVVAEQQYDPKVGTPQVQFPGFAVVFRMKNPDKFAPIAEEAFQKALGLVNFTRGQAAQPGLIIDRPMYGDVKYTVAAFAPPSKPSESPVGMHFNFQPVAGHAQGLSDHQQHRSAGPGPDRRLEGRSGGERPAAGRHAQPADRGRQPRGLDPERQPREPDPAEHGRERQHARESRCRTWTWA